jgi:YkoY family integral membrane protein
MLTNLLLIFNLFVLEGLLSIDNATVLAVMVKDLPLKDCKKALRYGIIGAYALRGICLLFASYLIHVWILKMLGGAYLIYLVTGFFSKSGEPIEEIKEKNQSSVYRWLSHTGLSRLVSTIILVEIMDLAFSIDNIFAAVAISDKLWVVCAGVFMGIAAMRFIAGWFVELLNKYPSMERSTFIVIGFLGVKLIVAGIANGLRMEYLVSIFENSATDMVFSLVMVMVFFIPLLKNSTV